MFLIPEVPIFEVADRTVVQSLDVLVGLVEVIVDEPCLIEERWTGGTFEVLGRREAKVSLEFMN